MNKKYITKYNLKIMLIWYIMLQNKMDAYYSLIRQWIKSKIKIMTLVDLINLRQKY